MYTANLEIKKPLSSEDAMDLLRDLLELLTIADEWDLPALKEEVGCLIAVDSQINRI